MRQTLRVMRAGDSKYNRTERNSSQIHMNESIIIDIEQPALTNFDMDDSRSFQQLGVLIKVVLNFQSNVRHKREEDLRYLIVRLRVFQSTHDFFAFRVVLR